MGGGVGRYLPCLPNPGTRGFEQVSWDPRGVCGGAAVAAYLLAR